ncbi:uncharacterized protein LOC108461998 [Gossypium arboreum]|uniref:Uncharacterized protein n=1 Tax=Gossypium arboreum TaxID=29729 RepID=A0ABR0MCF3_GOSAR|nr:uncharacterized protein LOC108461998 [Gossypium arboreum]KAK5770790.1 hypothetical protein PVK06_046944 [Gossypium arboreum]
MTPTPLLNIFIENNLNGNKYKEWKRNLITVMSCEKLKTVIDTKCPPTTQADVGKSWEESDEISRCYMLASMTNTLYENLESCETTKTILEKLKNMLGGKATLA